MRVLTELEARLLDVARPDSTGYETGDPAEQAIVELMIERGLLRITFQSALYRDTVITDVGLLALRCHNAYKASL
jgi:hypothetical protein